MLGEGYTISTPSRLSLRLTRFSDRVLHITYFSILFLILIFDILLTALGALRACEASLLSIYSCLYVDIENSYYDEYHILSS